MALKKGYAAGVQECFWSQIDSSGFMTAYDGTTTQGATASGMRQWTGMKKANPVPVEPDFPLITGDDGPIGRIPFGSNATPEWIAEQAVNDFDANAQLQSTTAFQLGDAYLNAFQPLDGVYPDICVIYNSKAKNSPTNTAAWEGVLFPACNAVPLHRDQYQERTPAVFKYKLLANPASVFPWGVTITEALQGTVTPVGFEFQADNPIIMQRFTGDGATTVFNLQKTPVSVSKTIVWTGNGQVVALASVSTTNKTMTFTVAPALGAKIEVFMEYTR